MAHSVAEEIRNQIGRRALYMIGAKNLVASEHSLSFKIGRNPHSITHITVTLDSMDTYTVEYLRCSTRAKVMRKVVAEFQGVYFDQLRPSIEMNTGLATSL